jgi:bifunctional non-homologous end joining protein LigD
MSLQVYKKKRRFEATPEPEGEIEQSTAPLLFVVQKHQASHLHYDFRLELKGLLKSWAVPKGPSMNPADKRLAMLVEDHPYSYKDFEGIIPPGNYGAGTVMVWDNGYYEPYEKTKGKSQHEKLITKQFFAGKINITLYGKKLKGAFTLIKAKDRGDNSWLLIKVKDKYATEKNVSEKENSVLTGRTLDEIKDDTNSEKWISNRSSNGKLKNVKNKKPIPKAGEPAEFFTKVAPMLATLHKKVFDDTEWLYEVKWDGYRIISYLQNGNVKLHTRNHLNYTEKYFPVTKALKQLEHDVIIDGEVVVAGKNGHPDFDALQKYKGSETLLYYVFDILWLDGYSLLKVPLAKRKEILKSVIPESDIIKISIDFDNGTRLFEEITKHGMEGIVAKRKDSYYYPGRRTDEWLKITTAIRNEYIIGGWTESASGRKFRSLLFGEYRDGKLFCIGHAGGGYKEKEMDDILNQLKKYETKSNPFSNDVETETKVHWLKPKLVGEFKFATWTKQGKIRKPAIFLGFREDKDVNELKNANRIDNGSTNKNETISSDSNWKKLDSQKINSTNELIVEEETISLTNIETTIWKGITKAALIEYYIKIAAYILPYIKDRPQSMHIKLNGATRPGFYIKDMEGRQPSFAEIFTINRKHKKEGRRDRIDYLVVNNLPSLIYMINLGCIDINPWTSRILSPLNPDYIVIDLDPSDNDFKKAIRTAIEVKKLFDLKKIFALVKTSGKSGLHILLPCKEFTFKEARLIAENICSEINKKLPKLTTTEITINKRGDKLYLDPNQNDEADTIAAPYCVRPNTIPTVSAPLDWIELTNKLSPADFTIRTIFKRLEKKGDLFKKLFSKKIAANNSKILKQYLNLPGL